MRADLKSVAGIGSRAGAVAQPRLAQESKAGFYLVLVYLLLEFGRPQDSIPGIKVIPFATGVALILLAKVLMSGKMDFARLQTRLWIPLFVVMAIHVPIAVNNFHALMTFKDMFLVFCAYLGIITFVDSLEKMMTLMKMWLGVHAFLAIMGIIKGGVGVGGWMGDENDFCMVMNMVVPFGYFLLFSATGVTVRMRYLALLGTFILAAMSTLSRGGFFGLTSVGTYCWYRSPKKLNALILIIVALVFMALFAPATYWDEILSSTDDTTMSVGTGAERLYTWGIGLEIFLHNPIIGIGQGNFPWTFGLYEGDRTFNEKSIAGRQAHSAWVTLIAELGLAGILIIGGMLFQSYRDLKWIRKRFAPQDSRKIQGQTVRAGEDIRMYLARAMEGSLIGYIVSSVFISTLWYPSLWIITAFVVALRKISEGAEEVLPPRKYHMGVPLQKVGDR